MSGCWIRALRNIREASASRVCSARQGAAKALPEEARRCQAESNATPMIWSASGSNARKRSVVSMKVPPLVDQREHKMPPLWCLMFLTASIWRRTNGSSSRQIRHLLTCCRIRSAVGACEQRPLPCYPFAGFSDGACRNSTAATGCSRCDDRVASAPCSQRRSG